MDSLILASMIFTIIVISLVLGTILVFPLTRRLGMLIERYLESDALPGSRPNDRVLAELHALRAELDGLHARQEFTERLLEAPRGATSEEEDS